MDKAFGPVPLLHRREQRTLERAPDRHDSRRDGPASVAGESKYASRRHCKFIVPSSSVRAYSLLSSDIFSVAAGLSMNDPTVMAAIHRGTRSYRAGSCSVSSGRCTLVESGHLSCRGASISRLHPQRVQLLMRPVTPARCLTLESQRGQFVNVSIFPPILENLPVTNRLSPMHYYPTLNRLNGHKQPVKIVSKPSDAVFRLWSPMHGVPRRGSGGHL